MPGRTLSDNPTDCTHKILVCEELLSYREHMSADPLDADLLHHSIVQLRHAVLRDGFLLAVRAMDQFELSVAQMATLMLLEAEGGATVGSLAADLGRSLSAASRLIDQMVRRELIARHEDSLDRRIKRVTLTTRGRELIELVQRQRSEAQRLVMEALTEDERAEVMRGMALLAEAASRRRAATATQSEPAEVAPIPAASRS